MDDLHVAEMKKKLLSLREASNQIEAEDRALTTMGIEIIIVSFLAGSYFETWWVIPLVFIGLGFSCMNGAIRKILAVCFVSAWVIGTFRWICDLMGADYVKRFEVVNVIDGFSISLVMTPQPWIISTIVAFVVLFLHSDVLFKR